MACAIIHIVERECWNWQTGTFEGRVFMTYGFKSRLAHHERNLFCLPRQERFFHAFRGKIALSIGKYC